MKSKNFDSSSTSKKVFSQAIISSILSDKDHISKQLTTQISMKKFKSYFTHILGSRNSITSNQYF